MNELANFLPIKLLKGERYWQNGEWRICRKDTILSFDIFDFRDASMFQFSKNRIETALEPLINALEHKKLIRPVSPKPGFWKRWLQRSSFGQTYFPFMQSEKDDVIYEEDSRLEAEELRYALIPLLYPYHHKRWRMQADLAEGGLLRSTWLKIKLATFYPVHSMTSKYEVAAVLISYWMALSCLGLWLEEFGPLAADNIFIKAANFVNSLLPMMDSYFMKVKTDLSSTSLVMALVWIIVPISLCYYIRNRFNALTDYLMVYKMEKYKMFRAMWIEWAYLAATFWICYKFKIILSNSKWPLLESIPTQVDFAFFLMMVGTGAVCNIYLLVYSQRYFSDNG